MRNSQPFLTALGALALFAGCVDGLPLEGAPCPCSDGLVCGKGGLCEPPPDGGRADVTPPNIIDPMVSASDAGDAAVADGPASDHAAARADGPTSTVDPCGFEPLVMGCGADGLVYGNACDARAAGTTFTPGTQCQSTGSCGVHPQMRAVGDCGRVVGWAWSESGCQPLVGCACSGSGCETLYPTLGACQRGHTMCKDAICKGTTIVCAGGATCVNTGADRCGRNNSQGECAPRPQQCPPETTPVCGCDGRTYAGQCAAQMAGADLDHDGPSAAAGPDGGAPAAADGGIAAGADPCAFEPLTVGCGADGLVYGNACDARLAGTTFTPGTGCQSSGSCAAWPGMRAVGTCPKLLGWSWSSTGAICLPLTGCACAGDGCQTLYPTLGACERAHFMCKDELCKGTTVVCTPDLACVHTGPGRCGRDGSQGECVPRPASCPPESSPVCGCNGKTYPGQCAARAAGTDIDRPGPC